MEQGEKPIDDEASKPGALERAINEYYEHKNGNGHKYPELAAIRERGPSAKCGT
jgi:hypothetical protein